MGWVLGKKWSHILYHLLRLATTKSPWFTTSSASLRIVHRVLGAIIPPCFLLNFINCWLYNFEFEFSFSIDFSSLLPATSFMLESWILSCLLYHSLTLKSKIV